MTFLNCENRRDCTGIAFVVSLIIGIIAAFLQFTAIITLPTIFPIIAFAVAAAYLAVALIAAALTQKASTCNNCCIPFFALLTGILGTILFSIILFVVDIAATSIIGAIIVGALFFFFSLMIITVTCLIRCFLNCRI